MKFWDTSAVVPLLLNEARTSAAHAVYLADPSVAVAWITVVECASAIARAEHDRLLLLAEATEAFARLDDLARRWTEVEPAQGLRDVARRMLRVHRLRSSDALQLASAYLTSGGSAPSLDFVTFDVRQASAAQREGFRLVMPGEAGASPELG